MHIFYVSLMIISLIYAPISAARQELPAFDEFTRRYAPPAQIIALVEQHKERILLIKNHGFIPEIPRFFIKVEDVIRGSSRLIHRVINAERLRRCIKKHNLHLLDVVKKYIYRLGGIWICRKNGTIRLDGKWIVLAEKIDFQPERLRLSLEELQQLAILAEKTLYRDWGVARKLNGKQYVGNNWVRNARTGKLTCIDTEDRSFEAGTDVNISGCTLKVILNYLSDELINDCKCPFKARRWLRKRKKKWGSIVLGKSLNRSTEYDSPDLDFEQVKKERVIELEQFTQEERNLRFMPPERQTPQPQP